MAVDIVILALILGYCAFLLVWRHRRAREARRTGGGCTGCCSSCGAACGYAAARPSADRKER